TGQKCDGHPRPARGWRGRLPAAVGIVGRSSGRAVVRAVAAEGRGHGGGRAGWAAAAVAGVPMCWLAFVQGGYFATAWGWAALAFLWVAAVALVVRRTIRLGRLDGVFLGGLAGLVAWMLVSRSWSSSPSESVLEAQRGLVYVA